MFKPLAAAVAATILAGAVPAQAEAPFSFAATPGKLPKDVIPLHYAAQLVPDFDANTFSGSQTVDLDVQKPTSVIMLNVDQMDIVGASLRGKDMGEIKLVPVIDSANQTLSFTLAQPLAKGRYQLALAFKGKLHREARGWFHLNYKYKGAERKMLASQMEPSDARRMLPLWDEPAFRATFQLSVDLPADIKAYSNTKVVKQEQLPGGLQRTAFGVTPKMPSYLLALAAGKLERIAAVHDGVDIGIVTTEGKGASATFALESTKDLLRYYNNYFGIRYTLPKLDQIAMPGGFNGAMENWGAIIYNEHALLVDPKTSPERVREGSFSTNAHEMAHQWFGNLVTMAWWDNLWLNEGFASWMGTKATQHFHPEWHPQLESLADREGVMNLDARKTTHPIQTPVLTEAQAASAFDAITYVKGQGFLRMLEAYLGEAQFRKGIRAYMVRHQYSNTTSADLWRALEKASGKPVEKVASDWTTQPGFPLISVTQSCVAGQRKVTLSQEQFRLDEPATDKLLWSVPVQIGVAGARPRSVLLANQSMSFTQPGCAGALVVDPGSVGFYRVHYDEASFSALAAKAAGLHETTRLKLQSDAWAMVQSQRMELPAYLKLVSQYANEPRLAVWQSILGNLGTLDDLAKGESEAALIKRFILNLAGPKFARLGWDEKPGDTVEERLLRAKLAGALADAGDAAVIAEARARFARYLQDPASVSVSMLDAVAGIAGRHADAAIHAALTQRTLKAEGSEERVRFLRALTRASDPKLAESTLALASSKELPPSVTARVLPWVANAGHIDQAWKYAVAHREALLKDQDSIKRGSYFPNVIGSSSNPADAERLEAFVKAHFSDDQQAEAKRAANGIRTRAALKARLLPQLRAALQ